MNTMLNPKRLCHCVVRYAKLAARYTRMSFVNLIQFPSELYFKFFSLGFDVLTVVIFWTSIQQAGITYTNWGKYELFILSGFVTISGAFRQLWLGFRDLEFLVNRGDFDKYLVRPVNLVFSVCSDRFFIFWFACPIVTGIGMIWVSSTLGKIPLMNFLPAAIVLILGAMVMDFIYATVTLLCFWFGRIYSFRSILFSITDAKGYPIDIFGRKAFDFFTYVFPVSLMATLPAKILMGQQIEYGYTIFAGMVLLAIWLAIFCFVMKKGLARYQSTGS